MRSGRHLVSFRASSAFTAQNDTGAAKHAGHQKALSPVGMTMSQDPRVSIGVPVYNGENFLAEALESVLAQTFADFEIVICDNASTDSTPQICKSFAERDPRIKYFPSETNLGAAINYNRTFELSEGEFFKWLAHDDLMAPEFLERCVAALDADTDAVLACPHTVRLDAERKKVVKTLDQSDRTDSDRPYVRFNDLLYNTDRHYVFGLIRSSVLGQTPLIGNYTDSDGNLIVELSLRGRFVDVPEVLLYLREHSKRSVRANQHFQKREAWFDPAKANKLNFPAWKALAEYHKSLFRVPLSFGDRARSLGLLMKWAIRHRWRVLGGQVKQNVRMYLSNSASG